MANKPKQPSSGTSNRDAAAMRYHWSAVTPGHYTQQLLARTVSIEAAFLLPHLRPGMMLLDCGCGPGTITTGLAEVVAPGRVVGIDMEEERIIAAKNHAAERGIANVEFHVANTYQLPFWMTSLMPLLRIPS